MGDNHAMIVTRDRLQKKNSITTSWLKIVWLHYIQYFHNPQNITTNENLDTL